MNLRLIYVSQRNKDTGNFTFSAEILTKIVNGEIHGLIVVDEDDRDDPFAGTLIKGENLWQIVGEALSKGPRFNGDAVAYFIAKRP